MSDHQTPTSNRWLRFFNNVVYERLPATYNALDRVTLGVWWRLVSRALAEVPPDKRVLEIGFGPGRLHVELARRARWCLGADLAWGMCQFTRHRLVRADLASGVAQANVYALPYPVNSFDVVVSTFAFSGFPDGARAMGEMVRVTTGGGRVVLVDIGLPRDGNRLGTVLAKLWERLGDTLHDLPALMRQAKLELQTFQEYGPGNHIRIITGQKTIT